MKKEMVCTKCGYCGKAKMVYKGSDFMELGLWICFIFPGLFYSLWRNCTKYKGCSFCGGKNMIPADSPMGQKIINEAKISLDF